ncbi:AraC family transcriptional regulator [Sabulicella rubraurantiaca]|uniref:AraC family transcriptional regulator n=1 Tax=Sabulicella rubraurantiaca TaxID=2811429 RepID=UPI001A95C4EF|nr:AraC family transcriptional regulator [Sabulicella rubraurantiaca]
MNFVGTQVVRLSDVDELHGRLTVGSRVACPLRPGPFSMETTDLGLGDVTIRIGQSTPVLVQGASPDGVLLMVLPLRHDGAFLFNGAPARPHSVATYVDGAGFDSASHADFAWAMVALRTPTLDRLDLARSSPVHRPGAAAMLVCDPAAWSGAARLMRDAAEVAATDPEVFEVEEARRSLRASVLEATHELLVGPLDGEPTRILWSSAARRRLILAADEILRAASSHVSTAVDLAAALGVPADRLRRAIRETFGMGTQRYILLRRLTMLRTAIRRALEEGIPPRSIALAHGFWDLDRLARDFQQTFGEQLDDLLGAEVARNGEERRRA